MSSEEGSSRVSQNRVVYVLALGFLAMGILNSMPTIPGWDDMWRSLTGFPMLKVRTFPTEWFYPAVFLLMMAIVAFQHSMWREWRGTRWAPFGLFMDVALVAAAASVSLTFLIEIDSVCLVDRITGERARLIAQTLQAEIQFAKELGLPLPDTVEDPKCVGTTGIWLVFIMGTAVLIFLGYNIKVWGLPLVLISLLIALYTIGTVNVWYFYGAEDMNKYLVTKLGGEPRSLLDGRPNVHDALVNNASGLLGRFMDVIMNTVFPYIVLGAMFGTSAGGQSLIKIAFRWTRKLRGAASARCNRLFRHVRNDHRRSGGQCAVDRCANDSDDAETRFLKGVCRRDGGRSFLGRIDHAAGDGCGGLRACGSDRRTTTATSSSPRRFPRLAYFDALFLSAVFQSRKQNIEAFGELTEDMRITRLDLLYLLQIALPDSLVPGSASHAKGCCRLWLDRLAPGGDPSLHR